MSYESVKDIDMVVRANKREDDYIDVCTEYGEVIITCTHSQWHHFLKGVKIDGKTIFKFTRTDGDDEYDVYPICKRRLKQIINVLKEQNEKDN